jgi:hypothetical protein
VPSGATPVLEAADSLHTAFAGVSGSPNAMLRLVISSSAAAEGHAGPVGAHGRLLAARQYA